MLRISCYGNFRTCPSFPGSGRSLSPLGRSARSFDASDSRRTWQIRYSSELFLLLLLFLILLLLLPLLPPSSSSYPGSWRQRRAEEVALSNQNFFSFLEQQHSSARRTKGFGNRSEEKPQRWVSAIKTKYQSNVIFDAFRSVIELVYFVEPIKAWLALTLQYIYCVQRFYRKFSVCIFVSAFARQ